MTSLSYTEVKSSKMKIIITLAKKKIFRCGKKHKLIATIKVKLTGNITCRIAVVRGL